MNYAAILSLLAILSRKGVPNDRQPRCGQIKLLFVPERFMAKRHDHGNHRLSSLRNSAHRLRFYFRT